MATYYARKAGNINATDVWATTPSGTAGDFFPSFTNADVLMSNSFAITVNVNATVAEVRNDTTGGATAGGSFTLSNGVTLTANVFAGTVTCVTFSGTAGNTATLVGNPTGGSASNAYGCNNQSTGTFTVTGNPTGGSGGNAFGCNNQSTGTFTVTGNPTGGPGNGAHGCNNVSAGTLTVTGNPTGGSASNANGCNNQSTGTMTVVGTINASEFNYGVGGTNRGQVTLLTGPFVASTTFGVNPIGCLSWRWAASLNDQTYITVPTNNLLATRNLVTPDNATNFPAQSDVRSAITYGIGGALTGTCAVPPAGSVALGVPVDATTGTAVLTGSDIANAVWGALLSSHTTNNTFGARVVRSLNSNNTLQLTGSHHAAADIHEFQDAVITAGAFAPSAITLFSDAMRTELTPELDEISEVHLIHGLQSGSALTVTPSSRTAGAISQTITGDGTTSTTVTRD